MWKLTNKKIAPCLLFFDICCLSADEKEEGILGSILLPSFHVSMLSVDDHINRKYAFKVCASFHSSMLEFKHPQHRESSIRVL